MANTECEQKGGIRLANFEGEQVLSAWQVDLFAV